VATVIPFFLSNFTAYFYHEPKIVPILKVLSLTFFISGLSILQQSLFERRLDFRSLAIFEIISSLIGSLVGLTLAFQGFGVWSLVFQSLVTTTVMTVLLFVFCQWKPRLVFKWTEVRSITGFSLNLTGYNIFNYFARNMDNILIGKFLGAEALGYYSLAYRIMLYPLQAIYRVIGRVIFPLFSQIQSEDARFRQAYLKLVSNIAMITFPVMMMVMVLAKPFVLVLFGPQWLPAVVIVAVLAPIGLIQSAGTTVGVIYQAKGRTDWMFRWGVGVGILVMIAFVVGLRWGILGVAVAYGIVSLLCAYHNFAIPFRLISLPMRELGRVLWRPFFCSLVMVGVLIVIKSILSASLSHAVILGILIFCGISVYLLTSLFINRYEMKQVWNMAIMAVRP
jgi:PST family polysaccharide transporter